MHALVCVSMSAKVVVSNRPHQTRQPISLAAAVWCYDQKKMDVYVCVTGSGKIQHFADFHLIGDHTCSI